MSSQNVKNWRIRTKQRIVQAMGGKCGMCGYNKCNNALELHHITPEEKDFSLGGIRANPRSWEKIVNELRKCILLCSNCHREVEAGITELPKNFVTFNEEYATYKTPSVKNEYICNSCNIKFTTTRKAKNQYSYCSPECAAVGRRKVKNRPTKEELIKLLETNSYLSISRLYDVSDNAVRKWVKKYEII
jgi:hypothetical protein